MTPSRIASEDHTAVDPPKRVHLTPPQRARLLLAFNGRCARCKEKIMDGQWEANHVTPLFQLREGDPQGFEPVHKTCHRELTDGKHAAENAKLRRTKFKHETPRDQWPKAPGFQKRRWPT